MNVGQLIKELSKHNPKLPVIVSGYEDGATIVIEIRELEVTYLPNNSWWEGEYEVVEHRKISDGKPFNTVKIEGRRH